MNQSIAVSHLQLEVEDATSSCIQLFRIRVQAKGKDQVPFAGAVLRCLVLLFNNILYVPHAVGILLEIP